MPTELKLAFAGTPALAATILQKLIDADFALINCVYTQPDRPAGRGRRLRKSAVRNVAEMHDLVLQQPSSASDMNSNNELANTDVLVVAAYGLLLPTSILQLPRLGCINVHTSLLPRWRGAAPVQRAIQAGDKKTGVTIMQMDSGLDTGDILLQKVCPIADDDTAASLLDRLAVLGAEALLEALHGLLNNTLQKQRQQNAQATYAAKISKAEARIDWTLPAKTIERSIRAFNPRPVAYTTLNNVPMRIWRAELVDTPVQGTPGTVLASSATGIDVAAGDGAIRICDLQLPGKKPIPVAAFHNSHPHFSAVNQTA